jgi:hypothetical protein
LIDIPEQVGPKTASIVPAVAPPPAGVWIAGADLGTKTIRLPLCPLQTPYQQRDIKRFGFDVASSTVTPMAAKRCSGLKRDPGLFMSMARARFSRRMSVGRAEG